MDKPRFILDSNILIDVLNGRLDLPAFLDTLPDCELYINPVVWVETLAKPDMTGNEETEARALLTWFLWADSNASVLDETVLIRRTNPRAMLLPDALIAASAISLKATVLSNDPHLRDFQRAGYAARPVFPDIHEYKGA
ncbi:MAG: PIN domain-containing protein [Treponema sp.]|jgi:predicted nucleic acid-binding protein|nr:PIN domain-containing protein [Treponema sp.]